jgi:hypothetical protein
MLLDMTILAFALAVCGLPGLYKFAVPRICGGKVSYKLNDLASHALFGIVFTLLYYGVFWWLAMLICEAVLGPIAELMKLVLPSQPIFPSEGFHSFDPMCAVLAVDSYLSIVLLTWLTSKVAPAIISAQSKSAILKMAWIPALYMTLLAWLVSLK